MLGKSNFSYLDQMIKIDMAIWQTYSKEKLRKTSS